MNVEYINPFVTSTVSVFSTMLSWQLVRWELFPWPDPRARHEINGIVRLSGQAAGNVLLSLEREVALAATEGLLGERPNGLDARVVDAVGELINVVVGEAKLTLEDLAMDVSLPRVTVGKHHTIDFPASARPICIPFATPAGELSLVVGLVEQEWTVMSP